MKEKATFAADQTEAFGIKKFTAEHHPDISLTRFLNVEYVYAKTLDGGGL